MATACGTRDDREPDTGPGGPARKGADVSMVGLRMINGCGTCERKETLGAMNSTAVTGPVMVNGTDDAALGWDAINWRKAERDVTRLRRRIFAAEQAGNGKKVASLQRLMLRSRANTLVSVRRVTQQNAGRATAGVDGQVALTSRDRAELADRLQRSTAPWQALPVKRVYIPKGNKKLRPLGIPPIADRAQQNRVRNALEPQWEARFEARSYGFRPGRGCHDAIEAVFQTASGKGAPRGCGASISILKRHSTTSTTTTCSRCWRASPASGWSASGSKPEWSRMECSRRLRREPPKAAGSVPCCSMLPCMGWRRPRESGI